MGLLDYLPFVSHIPPAVPSLKDLEKLVAVEAEAVVDGHPTVTPQEVRSLDFLSKLAWGEPVHLRQSDLVYNDLPTIDQVGPLKNVKVVPLPKPHGPANWWIGGVNIMRRKTVSLGMPVCSRVAALSAHISADRPHDHPPNFPTITFPQPTGRVHVTLTASGQKFWDATSVSLLNTHTLFSYDLHGGTRLSPELVLPPDRPFHPPHPGDPPRVTLVSTQSPVPKMFPLCAPDHGHFRYQLEIHGERFSFSVHDSVADSSDRHMMTQIEPRIDAVVHKVTINTSKVNPSQKFHPTDRGPHFGKVHLPKAYQDAMDRLDHTRRPAMTSNPYGIPMYKLRPGPDRLHSTANHHHNEHSLRVQDPDSESFPESFRDVLKRRDNWEEVRVSALHNGKMGLFDARHPPKNPEAVDSEAYSESHPLYDRARMPSELRHPVHEYEGFHDHIRFLHPSIEFRHWVHFAEVKLVDLETQHTLWDKLYEVHGHKIAADQRDIGGPVEFKGLDPRLGKLDLFKLTVDADNPHILPKFDTKPTSSLNDVHQQEIRGLTTRLDRYIANPPQSHSHAQEPEALVRGSASIEVADGAPAGATPNGDTEAVMMQPEPVHNSGRMLWKVE
ncbi:hypothetical protein FOZ60_010324 [Perkinsus olseni]|uniref:Uncharacterized protein n=1 Tax=Perkinsus olseni TaxID=32597 RepID=A0A7J6PDT6_PEROL|nr:hypothetical protein FOZ60_010324 [Perkinsus olseni]